MIEPLSVITHSISDLRYRLIAGSAEIEPLRILDTRVINWDMWRVTLHILGSSHAVTVERADRRLRITELFTCAPATGQATPLLDMAGDSSNEGCAAIHGLGCRVRLTPFPLAEGDDLRRTVPNADRLDHYFAGEPGSLPVTRVGWQAVAGRLRVETIHTYPESGTGVRSETVFTTGEER